MAKGGKAGCKSKAALIDSKNVGKNGSSESEIDTDDDGDQGPSMPNFEGNDMKLMGRYFSDLFEFKTADIIKSFDNKFYNKSDIDEKLSIQEKRIIALELSNASLLLRVRQNLCDLNLHQQRDRNYSIRIVFMDTSSCNDGESTTQYLWKNLLYPAFEAAAKADKLPNIPCVSSCVDWCHPLRGVPEYPSNRPIQLAFATRLMKNIFMNHRQAGLNHYKRMFGIKPKIFEDITISNQIAHNYLMEDEAVDQAWVSQGVVKFRLKGSAETVRTVIDPFGANPSEMTIRACPLPLISRLRREDRGNREEERDTVTSYVSAVRGGAGERGEGESEGERRRVGGRQAPLGGANRLSGEVSGRGASSQGETGDIVGQSSQGKR